MKSASSNTNNKTFIKAAIKNIIVAFVYVLIIVVFFTIVFSEKISKAISQINTITVISEEKQVENVKIDLEKNVLEVKPNYGSKYGNIIIEDLGIDLPLYYGDSLDLIKYGIGQSLGSYFPGEGGSIICMGHNTKGFLRRLPEIQIGTKIKVNTVYGEYTYTVYDTKVVSQYDLEAVYVQDEEEILMLYTCYPVNSIGHATQRFITYSSLDHKEM